mmetsp:Transcript_7982/g.18509  ORF Transcript_7982/g.18509 Transcript_7982/m.18509 type:complete len:81 (-) Transcript_7982:28-270(-)
MAFVSKVILGSAPVPGLPVDPPAALDAVWPAAFVEGLAVPMIEDDVLPWWSSPCDLSTGTYPREVSQVISPIQLQHSEGG